MNFWADNRDGGGEGFKKKLSYSSESKDPHHTIIGRTDILAETDLPFKFFKTSGIKRGPSSVVNFSTFPNSTNVSLSLTQGVNQNQLPATSNKPAIPVPANCCQQFRFRLFVAGLVLVFTNEISPAAVSCFPKSVSLIGQ